MNLPFLSFAHSLSLFLPLWHLYIQLTLEQQRCELWGSSYMWIFFNKYIQYYMIRGTEDREGWLWDLSICHGWMSHRFWGMVYFFLNSLCGFDFRFYYNLSNKLSLLRLKLWMCFNYKYFIDLTESIYILRG